MAPTIPERAGVAEPFDMSYAADFVAAAPGVPLGRVSAVTARRARAKIREQMKEDARRRRARAAARPIDALLHPNKLGKPLPKCDFEETLVDGKVRRRRTRRDEDDDDDDDDDAAAMSSSLTVSTRPPRKKLTPTPRPVPPPTSSSTVRLRPWTRTQTDAEQGAPGARRAHPELAGELPRGAPAQGRRGPRRRPSRAVGSASDVPGRGPDARVRPRRAMGRPRRVRRRQPRPGRAHRGGARVHRAEGSQRAVAESTRRAPRERIRRAEDVRWVRRRQGRGRRGGGRGARDRGGEGGGGAREGGSGDGVRRGRDVSRV
eukprot:31285-Pelagococcus_subviridis.AAC.14